jgi:hypothetical protein
MIEIPVSDTNFEEVTIDRVEKHNDGGYTICVNGCCFGGVPAETPVIPEPGMTARYYGGAGPGGEVFGLCLNGTPIFYKPQEQRDAERAAWLADYHERRRLTALESKLPETQIPGFEWTADMHEISGFGGGYERTCRAMVSAGCNWLSEHPDADPQFHGYKGVYGVIAEDNDDAKTLSKVVLDAAGGDCTGAMHQASIGHVLAWRRMGSWLAYQREMRAPRDAD